MASEQRERELKFDVPDGWQLPPLDALVPSDGEVERDRIELESTYYDTAEHDLLHSRVTLRRRTGDADTGWHLKVPDGDARREIRLPLEAGADVPDELATLTFGLRGGAPLGAVATLSSARAVHRVLDGAGELVAEVVVDDVRGVATGEVATLTQWREVEVELGPAGDEALLERAAEHLQRSGVRPAASTSKLARALGRTGRPDDTEPNGLAAVVAGYLDAQYGVLVGNDVQLRRGLNVVHGTRTAIRRYRSVLRVFADAMDADRAAELDGELRWYAEVLGRLRDLHVVRAHLLTALGELPPELVLGPVRARIDQMVAVDLAEARSALDEAMTGPRYLALLAELREWRRHPPLAEGRPANDLAGFLRKRERRMRRRLAAAAGAPGDEAMHRARKAAKRLRYAAELAEPVLGRPARRTRKRAKALQKRLGARQDAVIAGEFLLRAGRVAGTTPGENGFTFGLLYERQRAAADAADAAI